MAVTQRGQLSPEDEQRLAGAKVQRDDALEAAAVAYRGLVLEMVAKSSLREVARVTGLSTNTLQRWKNELSR
jgi:DNA invertase Pin-like site-specific DNA recombinase